jgi:hypothetical protein
VSNIVQSMAKPNQRGCPRQAMVYGTNANCTARASTRSLAESARASLGDVKQLVLGSGDALFLGGGISSSQFREGQRVRSLRMALTNKAMLVA